MSAPARIGAVLGPLRSRRTTAGITRSPGSTSRLPVWWGRADWIAEVRGALTAEVCRAHHVAADTVVAVARGMAEFADSRTGRDCRPTNERLVEAAQCSLSTVQRARRVLKALGLVVEVVAGRSSMTLAQRLQAHANGSSHRAIAAEFALCSLRESARRPQADLRVVDRDTPPVGALDRGCVTSRRTPLRGQEPQRGGRSAPAHTEKSRRAPAEVSDLRPRRLAVAAKARVGWLSGVPTGRMVPTLTRFALAGWSGDDVALAVRDALAARGWRRVPGDLRQPAAYLAGLLRDVDPADRPTVREAWLRELERRQDAYRRLLATGEPCAHGRPGGDVPSPGSGTLACPSCRAASQP